MSQLIRFRYLIVSLNMRKNRVNLISDEINLLLFTI